MRHMDELKDMLWKELDKIADKDVLSTGDLDIVQKLTHSIKSIDTIEAMEGYGREDRSYRRRETRSRRRSYSDGKGEMIEHLEDMMEDADDSKVKRAIEEAIKQIDR